jgi:hypothetical protein
MNKELEKRLIGIAAEHGMEAYENEEGAVTVLVELLRSGSGEWVTELSEVKTYWELAIELGY